ncbi:MAG TPA: hypothetical protein DDW94_07185 [Deltaproteobacteria bacterium]|nr:MAG: hypothetical protein A2Z79_01715 [Deltaproteobacteria bacterium GWA2_55_82]OGQ62550.1 MAG: hypothetical protein A3I81_08525 [Deltaproteobacteria bacterium RIFCSPLOWO2_02_FULL_55_12]OIJ74140.1 MAG: hypothetical protein A2V21_307620 [Deltaproteobacteria bacterium GWC2_55_46]HBG46758.1 hypothetical protein [Deltaproteobacteria bacterium]HCY11233.1 hypothetical protein [Deltaproteobacteria bacterium]
MAAIERPPTNEEIKDEDKRIRHLRRMIEFTIALILETPEMTPVEASGHVAAVREYALKLFPGKEVVFDLVYAPRLRRVLIDKFQMN